MANLPKVPRGIDAPASGPFGPHCRVRNDGPNGVTQLTRKDGAALATIHNATKRVTFVALSIADPVTVPYINAFLRGSGRSVIKNWRNGEYRIKAEKRATSGAVNQVRIMHEPKPETPVVSEPKVSEDLEQVAFAAQQAAGAVITVSGGGKDYGVPGLTVLPKVTLKGAGRGYSDLGGIIIPNDTLSVFTDAWKLRQQGDPAAIMLTGPAGTAKTQVVRAFAAYMQVPYIKVDAGAIRTADDWSGAFRQDPATKTWAHKWSPFAASLRLGIPLIAHVDELTRTESPAALNAFMGLLDETGTLLVPDANTVLTMPNGVLVVATANIGPEFVGTLPLDGAVRQRFPYGYRMMYPTEAAEAKVLVNRTGINLDIAERLVRMAVQQRIHRDDAQQYPSGAVISTRVLLSIAKRIGLGTDPRAAVMSTLNAQFDPGDDAALSVVVDSQFPKGYKPQDPGEAKEATITTERHWFAGGPNINGVCTYRMSDGTTCGHDSASLVHYGNRP
jgi:nitric oxide reductase NorQ protein